MQRRLSLEINSQRGSRKTGPHSHEDVINFPFDPLVDRSHRICRMRRGVHNYFRTSCLHTRQGTRLECNYTIYLRFQQTFEKEAAGAAQQKLTLR